MQGIGLELGPESKKDVVQHSFYRSALSAIEYWFWFLMSSIECLPLNIDSDFEYLHKGCQWQPASRNPVVMVATAIICYWETGNALQGWSNSWLTHFSRSCMSWSNTHIWIAFHKHDTKMCTELLFKWSHTTRLCGQLRSLWPGWPGRRTLCSLARSPLPKSKTSEGVLTGDESLPWGWRRAFTFPNGQTPNTRLASRFKFIVNNFV